MVAVSRGAGPRSRASRLPDPQPPGGVDGGGGPGSASPHTPQSWGRREGGREGGMDGGIERKERERGRKV